MTLSAFGLFILVIKAVLKLNSDNLRMYYFLNRSSIWQFDQIL